VVKTTPPGTIAPAVSPSACFEPTFTGENEFCGSGAQHGFTPQDLESAYRLPSTTAGSGQTVAIVDAYDDPNAQADLNAYRSTYNLPPCESGCFTKINQEGKTTYPEGNSEWALEISLDLDMVSAACPKCHILLVEAKNNTFENLGAAENEAAKWENLETKEKATDISNSYAAREIEVGTTLAKEYAEKYYTHSGVPMTFASGDNAYNNEREDKKNEKGECTNCSPSYPAGLANVVSVGGTYLQAEGESGRGWSEGVWKYSGSGCTLYATKPSYQKEFAKVCTNRIDNDISAEASAGTPVSVYDTYGYSGWQDVGGTSAATPLAAGAIALESSSLRNEGLEGIYKHPSNWYDITAEHNWLTAECKEKPLCNGELGYDGPTGVGTPNGGAPATPPSAYTESATGVTTTAATLNAVVDAEGSEAKYYFEYGRTTHYGSYAPFEAVKVSGYTKPTAVAQSVSGLKTSSEYHFRVVVKSAGGTTYGPDRSFWTAPKLYQAKIGSKGAGKGQFEQPQYTATNAQGDVWVSDYANNRIEEFSPTGEFIRSCGEKGSGERQFKGPTDIAIGPTIFVSGGAPITAVYVTDSGNNRIEALYEECTYYSSYGTGELSNPGGVAFGGFGHLMLVANTGANNIAEIETEGSTKVEATFGSKGSGEGQFTGPTDVAFGGIETVTNEYPGHYKDAFYILDSGNNRVQKYTVEQDSYVLNKLEVIWKFDSGFGTAGSGEGQLSSPTAIALDQSTGDLVVSDTGNKRIEEFLPNGTYVAKFGSAGTGTGSFERPFGLSISKSGAVAVADPTNNRVEVWSHPEWHDEPTPKGPTEPAEAPESALYRVSCVTWSLCEAVGEYSPESNKGYAAPLAEMRKNGNEWSVQTVPLPSGTIGELNEVSCVSSGMCVAVGGYGTTQADFGSEWNGGEWTSQSAVAPTGATESYLEGVSCTSITACTAVGTYKSSAGVLTALGETWNGSKWSLQTTAKLPSETVSSHLNDIVCRSSTFCIAVGHMVVKESGTEVHHVLVERWNGTEWTSSLTTPEGSLWSVSCASETTCMAVGNAEGKASGPLGERWNGTEWIAQSMALPEGGEGTLYGVSCGSSSYCEAVGRIGLETSIAEQWNGTEWTLQSTQKPENTEHSGLFGVSCVTATSKCLSVGYGYAYIGTGYYAVTLAEINTGEEPTIPRLPGVATEAASAVEPTKATLHGTVNPEALSAKYHFEYGTSTSYGSSISEASAGAGTTVVPESASISGLVAGTTYHYRIVATNSAGTSYGADVRFTTAPPVFDPVKGTGAFPVAFAGSGGKMVIETAKGTKYECKNETATGKVTTTKEVKTTLKLTGCTTLSGLIKCGKEGEIETKELKGVLVYTYPAKETSEGREAGLVLSPASGEVIAEFTCSTTKVVVKGSVIDVVTPLKKQTKTLTLAIKQSKGVQEPLEYETEAGGKVATGLTCAENEKAAEKCGEQETTPKITLTSEEGTIEE
jgi:hypothetical protein